MSFPLDLGHPDTHFLPNGHVVFNILNEAVRIDISNVYQSSHTRFKLHEGTVILDSRYRPRMGAADRVFLCKVDWGLTFLAFAEILD